MPDIKKLRILEAADKELVCAQIKSSPSDSCEKNFANLFMWKGPYKTRIIPGKDSSIIYHGANGILNFPAGIEPSARGLFEISKAFADAGLSRDGFVYDVPPEYAQRNAAELEKYYDCGENADEFDYIYEVGRLISLSGALLKKKRNLIRQFEKAFPNFCAEEMDAQNAPEAFEFLLQQNGKKDEPAGRIGLKYERDAILCAAQNFEFLGLKGVLLRPEKGSLAGVAVFSPINPQIFTVHFEKCDAAFKGAPQKLVWQEAIALKNMGAKFMNREQDLGVENLRRAKSSLDPCAMYKRKFLKLKEKYLA